MLKNLGYALILSMAFIAPVALQASPADEALSASAIPN